MKWIPVASAATMKPNRLLLAALCLAGLLSSARAAFVTQGNIDPLNPSDWTSSTDGCIGRTASGTLTVNGGSTLFAHSLNVGNSFVTGTLSVIDGGSVSSGDSWIRSPSALKSIVTVDGTHSTWTNYGNLNVGSDGTGKLLITNGGSVSVTGATYVGPFANTGTIDFGTNGGTLTTQSLFASPNQLMGTGSIITCGLVSSIDLLFDSNHGLQQTFTLQQSGQNITVSLNATGGGNLGAGCKGTGSLTIQDGVKVNSANGYVGFESDSTVIAKVKGSGSNWSNDTNGT